MKHFIDEEIDHEKLLQIFIHIGVYVAKCFYILNKHKNQHYRMHTKIQPGNLTIEPSESDGDIETHSAN